jgi:hypothetical protein
VLVAEAAFEAGDYSRAASFYAKTYLLRKLDYMSKEDHSHITMVSTWAAELYLDKINGLLFGY